MTLEGSQITIRETSLKAWNVLLEWQERRSKTTSFLALMKRGYNYSWDREKKQSQRSDERNSHSRLGALD
jgi:hypothetical protein